MPNYGYICNNCNHTWEEFRSYKNRLDTICPECASNKIGLDFSQFNLKPTVFKEFVTENIYPFNKQNISSKRKYKDEISRTAEKLGEQLVCKAIDFETGRNSDKPKELKIKVKQ